ncbi:MAG TPA: hypothetical protein VLA54_00580, partial [Acidimicrobiia bacterium]|nr:hypothetical protein [Acidimicrobiia bacterium]
MTTFSGPDTQAQLADGKLEVHSGFRISRTEALGTFDTWRRAEDALAAHYLSRVKGSAAFEALDTPLADTSLDASEKSQIRS